MNVFNSLREKFNFFVSNVNEAVLNVNEAISNVNEAFSNINEAFSNFNEAASHFTVKASKVKKSFHPFTQITNKISSSRTSCDIIDNHFCSLTKVEDNGNTFGRIEFNFGPDKLYRLSFSDKENEIKIEGYDTPVFISEFPKIPGMRLAEMKRISSSYSLSPTVITVKDDVAKKIKDHILANKELWPSLPRPPENP